MDSDISMQRLRNKNRFDKNFSKADRAIRYLLNPNEETELNEKEKAELDICKKIHHWRYEYKTTAEIIKMVVATCGIQKSHAYEMLKRTEEIFGRVHGIHKDYERNFLLENSRTNIKLAFESKKSSEISKALETHYKIAGLNEFVPDMPDFENLIQHEYVINLPAPMVDALRNILLQRGDIKLTDLIPPPQITHRQSTEDATAEEVK